MPFSPDQLDHVREALGSSVVINRRRNRPVIGVPERLEAKIDSLEVTGKRLSQEQMDLIQADFDGRPQLIRGVAGSPVRNYEAICGFEELTELCELKGNDIVVGFAGGTKSVRHAAASLAELKARNLKWDRVEQETQRKDPRNWIPGETFLQLVRPKNERSVGGQPSQLQSKWSQSENESSSNVED